MIVVGTHLDHIPARDREKKCQRWKDQLEVYRIGRNTSRNYPIIVHAVFVGCPPNLRGKGGGSVNIELLNNLIYTVASKMESPRGMCVKIFFVCSN